MLFLLICHKQFALFWISCGYLVRTSASRPGVPGLNPIAAPKSYEVYPSTSGLLSFNKPETVLWTIANNH